MRQKERDWECSVGAFASGAVAKADTESGTVYQLVKLDYL